MAIMSLHTESRPEPEANVDVTDGQSLPRLLAGLSELKQAPVLSKAPLTLIALAMAGMANAGTRDEVFEVVIAMGRSILRSDGVSIALKSGGACRLFAEDSIAPLWASNAPAIDDCIEGWSMVSDQMVIVPAINADRRVSPDQFSDRFVQSLMIAPVRVREPIAAIGAYWATKHIPTSTEIDLLSALAAAASAALETIDRTSTLNAALDTAGLLNEELRHRLKNAYAGTQALARMSLPPEHADVFTGRVGALSRVHTFLHERDPSVEVSLSELLDSETEPYRTHAPDRVRISGPTTFLDAGKVMPIGLILNELATNSLKHGALSTFRGKVQISWAMLSGSLFLSWKESDGPRIDASPTLGLGSSLLKRIVERYLGGTLECLFDVEGAQYSVVVPNAGNLALRLAAY